MLRSLAVLGLVPALGFAQGQPCHDLQALTPIAQDYLATYPQLGDCSLQIDQNGQTVYRQTFGTFTLQQVVAIASATKTLSAAVLLALVDEGRLSLDDRVGQYLPEYNTPALAPITLRMCFSHTSGMVDFAPAISDDTITLRAAAQQLATLPLGYAPGTAFEYGGVSMHVAGAVCEVASGRSWAQLFQQKIAGPLQMTATDYYAFGPTQNPRIAGGARTNLRDFGVFVDMLRQGGMWGGQRVLSSAMVDVMLADQTSGLPVRATPHPDNAPYGIGIWLDRRDAQGSTVMASAAGAFGFTGWVDRGHAASGVFLTLSRYPLVHPFRERIWQELDDALLPAGVACFGAGSPPCAGGAWLTGNRAAVAGESGFVLHASRGPANAMGGLLLGAGLAAPLPLFDLDCWIGLPAPVFTLLASDAAGRASLAASLQFVPAGTVLAAQGFWLDAGGCGAVDARTSHAVQITVLP